MHYLFCLLLTGEYYKPEAKGKQLSVTVMAYTSCMVMSIGNDADEGAAVVLEL